MSGDAGNHAGEYRPTKYVPLPRTIQLSPNPPRFPRICPGNLIMNEVHPENTATKPFYRARDGFQEDDEVANWTVEELEEFDADERIFMVIAHDLTLINVVEIFPNQANEWKAKKLGRKSSLAIFGRLLCRLRRSYSGWKGLSQALSPSRLA
jgi:hypothetical protein